MASGTRISHTFASSDIAKGEAVASVIAEVVVTLIVMVTLVIVGAVTIAVSVYSSLEK